jgi:DNA-binding CsgD family transcriptional regulator
MYLTQQDAARIGELVNWLSQDCSEQEIRSMTGNVLLRVLKADYFASFVWDEPSQSFANSVAINMGMDNLEDYLTYFQYHDPITPALQKRRTPTLVTEVMPQDELMRTEFFNDFLAKDGLHYGINVYAYHGTENIGDLRIWRSKKRENFDETALLVLSIVQPAFTAALAHARQRSALIHQSGEPQQASVIRTLSQRELAIARCVCRGITDKEIARDFGIEFSTVRTHIKRIFNKLDVRNRLQLTQLLGNFI